MLTAFTLTGEVRDLGVTDEADGAYRIDDSRILYVTSKDEAAYRYWVASPDEIRLVWTGTDERYLPTAYHHPYVLLTPITPRYEALFTPVILINLEDGATVELRTLAPSYRRCCVFSADGSILRYIARTDTGIELRERVMDSGTETTFYRLDITEETTFTAIFHGAFGNFWLVANTVETADVRTLTYELVDSAGETEIIQEYTAGDTTRQDFRVVDQWLVAWDATCTADCTLTTRDLLTNEAKTFDFGDGAGNRGVDVEYVDADRVVVRIWEDNSFYRLHPDVAPELLGYWTQNKIGPTITSSDGQWSVLLNDPKEPEAFVIWNHLEADPAHLRLTPDIIFLVTTSYTSLLVVRDIPPDRSVLSYNMQTGVIQEWKAPNRAFVIPISDSQALAFSSGEGDIEAGVYLMEHEGEGLTPLLAGNLRPLEGYHLSQFNF